MNAAQIKEGQRVEVQWYRHGWLAGTFLNYTGQDASGKQRCKVEMDNGWPCDGFGYDVSCVRPAPQEVAA